MDSKLKYFVTISVVGFLCIQFFGTFFGLVALFFLSIFIWYLFFPKNDSEETIQTGKRGDRAASDSSLWTGSRKLKIEYTNAKGEFTDRNVNLKSINSNKDGEVYLRAYCELRDETRTFRADRVEKVTDARKNVYSDFFEYMNNALDI